MSQRSAPWLALVNRLFREDLKRFLRFSRDNIKDVKKSG